jgi:hypothetical protein
VSVRPGVYAHHKGGRYRVLGLVHDADDARRSAVLYVPLYPVDGPLHAVRGLGDFCAEVRPGVPRFRYVPEADAAPPVAPTELRRPSDVRDTEVDAVARALSRLDLGEGPPAYASLGLCVLEAVFAPNARYTTVRRLVARYATWAGLPLWASDTDGEPAPLSALVAHLEMLGAERFAAEVLDNRQRTRTSPGAPLKAAAAYDVARVLVSAGVETVEDLRSLRGDAEGLAVLDTRLAEVPGHGSGARLAHLHALTGDPTQAVPGRHVRAWLSAVLDGRPVAPDAARVLVARAASALSVSAWQVGEAVWRARQPGTGGRRADPG